MISRNLTMATLICATMFFASAQRAAGCSNSSLAGAYGLSFGGTDKGSSPNNTVGLLDFDGKGGFTGILTVSKGGVVQNGPVSGTYEVSPNCTGSATVVVGGKTRHLNLVVTSRGAGFDVIQTDSGRTLSGSAIAQGKPTCTDAGVKGIYGFQAAGLFETIGPVAFTGQLKLDGAGNVTGTESGSLNGTIFSNLKLTGTYTINSNCTGSAKVTPQGLSAFNLNLVIINGGRKMLAIETDANTNVSGSAQK
jgi:hypothetical protein